MFAVDHILISDDVLDAPFSCDMGACHGACCVQGDAGAPLTKEECAELERLLPSVRASLRPEALRVIEERGVWEEVEPGHYATTCVGAAECVFVVYDGPVARCALQQAFFAGIADFPKPISCHLYPIRVERFGDINVLNYEQISICDPAREHGRRTNTQLADFLHGPLQRAYGEDWYAQFHVVCGDLRDVPLDEMET